MGVNPIQIGVESIRHSISLWNNCAGNTCSLSNTGLLVLLFLQTKLAKVRGGSDAWAP